MKILFTMFFFFSTCCQGIEIKLAYYVHKKVIEIFADAGGVDKRSMKLFSAPCTYTREEDLPQPEKKMVLCDSETEKKECEYGSWVKGIKLYDGFSLYVSSMSFDDEGFFTKVKMAPRLVSCSDIEEQPAIPNETMLNEAVAMTSQLEIKDTLVPLDRPQMVNKLHKEADISYVRYVDRLMVKMPEALILEEQNRAPVLLLSQLISLKNAILSPIISFYIEVENEDNMYCNLGHCEIIFSLFDGQLNPSYQSCINSRDGSISLAGKTTVDTKRLKLAELENPEAIEVMCTIFVTAKKKAFSKPRNNDCQYNN